MNLEFLTSEVCKIAKEGGHFLAQERRKMHMIMFRMLTRKQKNY